MNLQSITALRKYLSIAKHEPGNLSLKFSLALLSDQEAMKVIKENKVLPQAILSSNFNLITRTVKIKYDTNVIEPDELTDILTTRDKKQFDLLADKYSNILSA